MNIFNAKGQSLVECVIVLPLFFLTLAGLILLFRQQNRVYQDEKTLSVLALSDAHFVREERKQALWRNSTDESQIALERMAKIALNPDRFFSTSVDQHNGVFFENQLVTAARSSALQKNCSFSAVYNLISKGNGVFALTTCAQGNGYEVQLNKEYETQLEAFAGDEKGSIRIPVRLDKEVSEPIEQIMTGSALFYPYLELSWGQRERVVVKSVRAFFLSPMGSHFSRDIASLLSPTKGVFNVHCFLEPFSPTCQVQTLRSKFSRTAKDSANLQINACFLESAIKCAGASVAAPACLVAKAISIVASVAAGQASPLCPVLNNAVSTGQWTVQKTVSAYSSIIKAQEIGFSSSFLSIN
ncbi:hypothetical protein [Fluviispira sanaruensis]|uniref:Uncharacterized protein n=1 Tax=Fluviispira sanaruensis TaxID=2493639 RepID=A0A4P2VJS5_FLUSA|nr:hypothetical protein [Fluviispira sanaruensis]BBH53483.1 hypothetical protein JCM31447_19270 [Fluviispira sanaruensis]